jgi:hypothetical protein
MVALTWSEPEKRFFETGVSKGVLYTPTDGVYDSAAPWNGLVSVTQSPSGAEATPQYADNIKYANLISAEEFGATIECFAFPDAFLRHDGVAKTAAGMQIGQQSRPAFGFSWQTKKGNAEDEDLGFIVNLAYGLQAGPTEKAHNTVNDSPELVTFSFTVTSTPVAVTGYKPTAIIKVDSTDDTVTANGLAALLDELYGTGAVLEANLPLPDDVDTLLATV